MRSFQQSLFLPESPWVCPTGLPEYLLHNNDPIAIDTETCDPLLRDRGPSWRYEQGHICGLCLATQNDQWYFPVGHLGGGNLDKGTVFSFFAELLRNKERTVYMAHANYDVGWLRFHDLLEEPKPGSWPFIHDVILTDALLCEEHPMGHGLDALAHRYLNKRKDEGLLRIAARELQLNPKKDLWKFPSKYVGPYGEWDARITFDIGQLQPERIAKDMLDEVWKLEMDLIPLIHQMTYQGIPIDEHECNKLNDRFLSQELELKKSFKFDPWSTKQVGQKLSDSGFTLPKTSKGNISADKAVLKSLSEFDSDNNPLNLPAQIMTYRKINRLRKTFVEDALKWSHNGRIRPEFIQMAHDEGGTRSGRMASKNPNFQQVPKRGIGKAIRSIYWSGDKGLNWGKLDYSSQEPRWQVHYGLLCNLRGAKDVRASFMDGVKLYTWMEENIPGISYDDAKMLVLARSYGMGIKTLSDTLQISKGEARTLMDNFDEGVPYISQLADMTRQSADSKGFICTYLGRRRRFLYWENVDKPDVLPVFGKKAAQERWPEGRLRRAYTNKAFNSLIQGSSADQTKKAMLDIWKDTGKVPLCAVHDELDYTFSEAEDPKGLCRMMEETFPDLLCPFKVDCDLGKTWQ